MSKHSMKVKTRILWDFGFIVEGEPFNFSVEASTREEAERKLKRQLEFLSDELSSA